MRLVAGLGTVLIGLAAANAVAQGAQDGVDPQTGARPGNEVGTGASWPLSDKASNIAPSDTTSSIAPNLPSPPIGENASVRDYLLAARSALFGGRSGEAQQALEMAATRSLDRSVPLFQTNIASSDPLVNDVREALQALSAGDRGRAVQVIEMALGRTP
jgi:hypothetical protein